MVPERHRGSLLEDVRIDPAHIKVYNMSLSHSPSLPLNLPIGLAPANGLVNEMPGCFAIRGITGSVQDLLSWQRFIDENKVRMSRPACEQDLL